jgi:F-type H+-transporting ATPase subunit delta
MNEKAYARYAEALKGLIGNDPSLLKDYEKGLSDFGALMDNDAELKAVLSSYSVPKERLFSLVDELTSKSKLTHLAPFLKVLIDKHLIDHFNDILQAFLDLSYTSRGVKAGIVYSVSPLSKEEMVSLEESLSKKIGFEAKLEIRVERSLLGGIKVYLDGKVYDGSLENQLEILRNRLLEANRGKSI